MHSGLTRGWLGRQHRLEFRARFPPSKPHETQASSSKFAIKIDGKFVCFTVKFTGTNAKAAQFNLHDGHVKAHIESMKPVLHDAHVKELKSDNTRYVKWKYHNVPRQMLYHRIKRWMHKHLGDKLPSRKWAAKLGYTTEELRVHLERQFTKGMTWENKGAWHIDHLVPVASFEIDSMDSPDLLACFGLHNLRPMWGIENIKKGAKREYLL